MANMTRHIPACETAKIQVQSFADALIEEQSTEHDYNGERWLYVPSDYREYRYLLGIRGANPLICIGINPSTARPDALDNTLKSVERIATANSFSAWMMFNVYAQRATNPDDMDAGFNAALHRENMAAFRWLLARSKEQPTVWAAWGTIIRRRGYLSACMEEMASVGREYGARWVSAGKRSRDGHPHHPLYLPKNSSLDPFDIEDYLAAFS